MTCKRPRSKKIEQASPVIMVSQKNKKNNPLLINIQHQSVWRLSPPCSQQPHEYLQTSADSPRCDQSFLCASHENSSSSSTEIEMKRHSRQTRFPLKICENINVTHRPPSHTPEIKAVEVHKEPTTYNGQFEWDEISSQKKKSLTASTVFLTLVSSVVIVPHLFNCWHDNMNHKNKALTQIKSRKETKPGWLLAAAHHLINNSTSSELGKTHNNSRSVNVILVATFCN